jgi:hypothetical protein
MKKITIVALAMLALMCSAYAQSAPTPAPTTSAPVTPTCKWEYGTNTDKITGAVTKTACLFSNNKLEFKPPYDGGSQGVICLGSPAPHRRWGASILSITKGQFVCEQVRFAPHSCALKAKFDDGKVFDIYAQTANDGSPNVFVIENFTAALGSNPYFSWKEHDFFLRSLKKSKHLMVEATFYQEGMQVLEFDTDGLVWEEK